MITPTRSVWTAALATLLVGGVIGASVMGLYIHRRLSGLLPQKSLTQDDLYLATLGRTFGFGPAELAEIRKEIEIEAPLRTLSRLEALPILNRATHVTMKSIENRLPPEKRTQFLKLVAESMKKKRPRAMAELYGRLLLTADQYREIEKIHAAEIAKNELPATDAEKAVELLLVRTRTSAFSLLTPEQQRAYDRFLVDESARQPAAR